MLKNQVRQAVQQAVRDLMTPVTDRSIKVAATATQHVVTKDFAGEADETKMLAAAHHMMRSLTAGMAMITCHEPLLATIEVNWVRNVSWAHIQLVSQSASNWPFFSQADS